LKSIVITQSNYIPWKGYFDSIKIADEFVIYDDMQFTRRDWRNRNKIKTPQGIQWLTIPVEVKGKYHQKINETVVSDKQWAEKHWKTISSNYKKALRFAESKDFAEHLYTDLKSTNLSEINYWFLTEISKWMNIKTRFTFSSDYELEEDRTDRLIGICKDLGGTHYYTGPAAKEYMDEAKFSQAGIKLHYFDYSGYKEYPQIHPPFDHAVTILDLLFNTGKDFPAYMKSF
jgi:hypothetical protein